MSAFAFFDSVTCLNQASRPDRWAQAVEEFARVQMPAVKRFLSVDHPEPLKSFCLSQHEMLKQHTGPNGLFLEDDVVFKHMDKLMHAFHQLPADWDVCYLGCNLYGDGFHGHIHPYSKNLNKLTLAWTTHAVAYSRRMIDWIVANYDPMSGQMYDNFLSNHLHLFKSFVVKPMVAWQRPVWSDLWGKSVDYTGCFDNGNKILR